MSKASDAVEAIFAAVSKKYGGASVMTLAKDPRAVVREVIPTGIEAFDKYLLGCGGLPLGRVSEVFGVESSGKSSFVARCIAAVQAIDGVAILLDAENAFIPSRARVFGADPERVVALDPQHLQDGLNMLAVTLAALPDNGPPVFAALDSVPALITREELEGDDVGDELPGIRARIYGRALRHLIKLLPKKRAHLMFVNQLRMKIGVKFGNPETTPGGNAIKFFASHRVRFGAGKEKGGITAYARCIKNKVAEPHRELEMKMLFDTGWDDRTTTINLAKELGVISKGAKGEGVHEEARRALGWDERVNEAAKRLGADGETAAPRRKGRK